MANGPERDTKGRLLPGHSISKGNRGNPNGGPGPGPRAKKTQLSSLIDDTYTREEQRELLQKFTQMALDGDTGLARSLVDRIVAPLKPRPEPVVIPDLDTSSPVTIAESVLIAVAQGDVDPEAGQQLVRMVSDLSTILANEQLGPQLIELREQMASISRR